MKQISQLSQKLARFEGLFCSGFFIPDQAMVTALALLFERVHFLNQLEYVIQLSKKYSIEIPHYDRIPQLSLKPIDPTVKEDPLASLSPRQRRTVHTYLYLSDQFFIHNALLFPDIFSCSLLPKGEVLSAKLIKKGKKGELNTYRVTRNPIVVSTEAESELNKLLSEGKIPIIGGIIPESGLPNKGGFPATQIATALAIKSVALVLPGTKAVEPGDIREARERLKNHLPPFWSSMLKLSSDLSERLKYESNERDMQREVDHAVSTIVRPALIDLVSKIEKEHKQWFYRILSPLAKGLRVLAGRPPSDLAALISNSLTLGSDIALDVAKELRKVDALKQESGLAYLIELYQTIENPKRPRKSG
jgi:hypothetical protein